MHFITISLQYVQPQILKTSNQGLGLFDEPDNPYTPNPCSNLSIIRPPLLLMHQMIPTVGGHLYVDTYACINPMESANPMI